MSAYLAQFFDHGDNVAIWAPNSAHWFLYQFAASHLGLLLVTINPAMRQVQTVFGMTEGSGSILMTTKGDPIDVVSRTVGTPLPHVDTRIVDPGTDTIAQIGEIGEITLCNGGGMAPCTIVERV